MYDSNNPVNMIMTDGDYYNIPSPGGGASGGGSFNGTYNFNLSAPYWWWATVPNATASIYWSDTLVAAGLDNELTSYTAPDNYTYYRGNVEYTIDLSFIGGGSGVILYYGVGRA